MYIMFSNYEKIIVEINPYQNGGIVIWKISKDNNIEKV